MNKKNTTQKTRTLNYSLSFLMPIFILLFIYSIIKIWPFGVKSLLTVDLNSQYIDFIAFFKDTIENRESIFYSFTKGIGGNTLGLYSYYIASPFNILFLVIPKDKLPEGIILLTLFKTGLMGLSMYHFLIKRFNIPFYSWIFSAAYALCSSSLIYQQNIMWMDGMILLPLIALGIYDIVKRQKFYLYYLTLTVAIISNWYMGYILCVFSIVYYVYEYILSTKLKGRRKKLKIIFKGSKLYITVSLLSVGSSCFLLLPTVFSLASSDLKMKLSDLIPKPTFNTFNLLSKYIIGAFDFNQLISGLPNIYSGFLTIILVLLLILNKYIDKKTKYVSIGVLFVLLLSLNVSTLNIIWHGFRVPTGFPYRNSFVITFFLITIGMNTIGKNIKINVKNLLFTLSFFLCCVMAVYIKKNNYPYLSTYKIYITVFFIFIYGLLIFIHKRLYKKTPLKILLFIMIIIEFSLNGYLTLKEMNYVELNSYSDNIYKFNNEISNIKNTDDNFFRIEKTYFRSENDSMSLNYKGVNHYSSNIKGDTNTLMENLGIRTGINRNIYNFNTPIADSILGIKYLIYDDEPKLTRYPINESYNLYRKGSNFKIYENPYNLPLGFIVDNNILNVSLEGENPLKNQNDILKSMVNTKSNFLSNLKIHSITTENLVSDNNTNFHKIDISKDGYIKYELIAEKDGEIYSYFPIDKINSQNLSDGAYNCELIVNDKNIGSYFNEFNYNILPLGNYKKGEKITLTIKLLEDELPIIDSYFYSLDEPLFGKAIEELKKETLTISYLKNTEITGNIKSTGGKLLYTSIPYDKGWKIKINGEKVNTEKILNGFLGVSIPEGDNKIEITFIPQGLKSGILISLISITLLVLLSLNNKKTKA